MAADEMNADEMRSHLKRLGISQAAFARALGHPPRTVERWCAGWRIPGYAARIIRVADRDLIKRLLNAVVVDAAELVAAEGETEVLEAE